MAYRIVIPAFNAERTLGELVRRIRDALPQAGITIVDDGSDDATQMVIQELGVHCIRHPQNLGKGEALRSGFADPMTGSADAIIQMDSDLQHAPESLPAFVEAFERGEGDLLVGRRARDNSMPWPRRMSNRITSKMVSRLAGCPVPDSQCGYRLIARRVLGKVNPRAGGFDFESEFLILAGRAGFKIGAVPIETIYHGETSAIRPWRDTWRFVRLVGLSWDD